MAAEFLLAKASYKAMTGREQKKGEDVLCYQIRQSFYPGEITPEEANRVSYELAMRWTKGRHAFIVTTHTDKEHIHSHIYYNSTTLDCSRKFRNFWGSSFALRRLSDRLCLENGLSIVENPKPRSKGKFRNYGEWLAGRKRPLTYQDRLRAAIDTALAKRPADFPEFLSLMEQAGYEVKQRRGAVSFRAPGQERFTRLRSDTLGDGYGEADIRAVLSGSRQRPGQSRQKVSLAIDIQSRLQGKGPGYERWAKVFNLKQMAAALAYLQDNGLMDYEQLENAITEKTKVIIPVDLGGVPCDYDRIFSIVERKKDLFHPANKIQKSIGRVIVMADAAHAFGATWKEKPVGSIADFSNFSFHAVKNFTTAEGGAAVWKDIEGIDNEEIYHQYQLLSLHGQSKDALAKTQLGAWEYDIIGPWFKCNMTDVVAGIGLAQMKRYKGLLERRKEIIGKYDAAFKPIGIEVLNHYTENHQSSGHLYITRVPGITLEQRHEIIVKMAEVGVACNVHYKPLPMMTAYKNMGFDIKDYPNAYKRFENEITLPLHTKLTDEEVDYVIKQFSRIVKEYI